MDADLPTLTPSETMTDDLPPDSPSPHSEMGGDESTPVREFDRKMAAPRTHDGRMRVMTEHLRALTEQEIRTRNEVGMELRRQAGLFSNFVHESVGFAVENGKRHDHNDAAIKALTASVGALAEQNGQIARELASVRTEAAAERAARVQQDSVHEAEITGVQRAVTATASDLAIVRAKAVGAKGLGWALGLGAIEALKYLLSHLG